MSEPEPWQVRAAERNARRDAERRAGLDAQWGAEHDVKVAEARAAFLEVEPEPPGGCHDCYQLGTHPSFGEYIWVWWHRWPEDQPFENWVCHHDCHGPGGQEQLAIAYA